MFRAVAVFLLISAVSGIVPLLVNRGSCASMPCCHKTKASISGTAGCCSPSTCIKEDQALGTATAKIASAKSATPAAPAATIAVVQPLAATALRFESPPLSTSQRLSSLSVLLI